MSWRGRDEYSNLGFTEDSATVLDIDRVQTICQRRAGEHGINVKWCNRAKTAYTDGRTITIPALRAPLSKDDLAKIYMYVVHETGHLMRPVAFDIANAAQPNDTLFHLYNMTEDDGMERWQANRYLGDAKALGEGNLVLLKEATTSFKDSASIEQWKHATAEDSIPLTTLALHQMSRACWDSWSHEARREFLEALPTAGRDLLVELIKEKWVERWQSTVDEHDTWDLACDLYDRLYPPEDEKEKEKRNETRANGHSKQPPSKDDKPDGNDKAQAEQGEGEGSSKGEGNKKPIEAADKEGHLVSWKDVVLSEHKREKPGGPGGAMGITWEDYVDHSKIGFMPEPEYTVMDFTSNTFNIEDYQQPSYYGNRRGKKYTNFMPTSGDARALGNQIRRHIQAKKRTQVRREREHGMLDKRSIVKVVMPPIDGGNWNKKIFYDMSKRRALNTAVFILVDWSGSMNGDKMKYAADAAQRCNAVFDRVLKVPTMIAAFTTGYSRCDIGVMKRFGSPVDERSLAERFSMFSKFTSGNADSDAVMWAYRRLMQRKEERKLLIVMSDGAPAGSYIGNAHNALVAATKHIQDEGAIELFGLGLKSKAVAEYYEHYKVVDQAEDINSALLRVIQEGVTHV